MLLAPAVQRLAKGVFTSLPVPIQAATDLLRPSKWAECGGPMNGQRARAALVRTIIGLNVVRVVETGTFRGDTAIWFASFGVPVWTVEVRPRDYWVSRLRLLRHRAVHLEYGHSVTVLDRWIQSGALASGLTLFYLDAHWQEDLPLHEEIDLVVRHVPEHIIVVDDFEVPGDPGYQYDDYGPGKRLCVDYLAPFTGLQVFFPTTPSAEESGRRRGCCVLTADTGTAQRLRDVRGLRWYGPV